MSKKAAKTVIADFSRVFVSTQLSMMWTRDTIGKNFRQGEFGVHVGL